jgi:phosphopantothenoylcysteine decarboxylase
VSRGCWVHTRVVPSAPDKPEKSALAALLLTAVLWGVADAVQLANGLCDNLLTCVVRAWDWDKPLLVAPAMNTFMWDSPFTARHLDTLQQLGARVRAHSSFFCCAGAWASPVLK